MTNKYPLAFQEGVLCLAMTDLRYLALVSKYGQANYFETESLQWLFRTLQGLWTKARTLLSEPIIDTELSKVNLSDQPIYGAQLWALWNERHNANAEYIRTETLEWLKRNIFVDGHRQASDFYNSGKFEDAVQASLTSAHRAANLQLEDANDCTFWMMRDLEQVEQDRMTDHMQRFDTVSGTGIESVDIALGGGLRPQEFGCILGLPKSKKSISLSHIGCFSMRIGLPTVMFVLEGTKRQTIDRIDAILMQTAYPSVRARTVSYQARYRRREEAKVYTGMSDLIVKVLGSRSKYTTLDLEEELDSIRAAGMEPACAIIDYCDLMYPADGEKYGSRYESQAQVFRDTKKLAERNFMAVWTAIQARRPTSKKATLMTEHDVADSYEKARVCDFILSLNQSAQDEKDNYVNWHLAMCRDNPGGATVRVFMNWDKMEIIEAPPIAAA
jgi:hypothetical protein